MLKIRKVLFPTDFSSSSQQALLHAVRMARDYNAELHVLHAIVLYEEDPHDPAHHFPDPERIRKILEDLAEERMGTLVREKQIPDLVLKLVQRRDISAAPPILEYAQEEGIDLIVMGTHGRRGVRKWLMGSVTNEVVRFAPCPVLTVRGEGDPVPVEKIRKIVVPVDFSNHGEEALGVACVLSSRHGSEMDLVHVVPDGLHPALYQMTVGGLREPHTGIAEKVEASMEEFFATASPCDGLKASCHALEGHPAKEIVRFARNHESDLIVISTHGLSGVLHLLLGSTTEKVMAGAECPVLVTPASGKSLLA